MFSFRRRPRSPPPEEALAALLPEAIPRYPPFLQGIPAAPVTRLLADQAALIERIRATLGLGDAEFDAQVYPVLERYAAFVHLLPASEAHHHRGAGGLLRHGLEVAWLATQAAQSKVFGYDQPPAQRRQLEPAWQLGALYAGLCHDLGKPLTDLTVTGNDGSAWNPYLQPLSEWLQQQSIRRYFLHWRDGRRGQHELATVLVVHRILTPSCLGRLAAVDPRIVQALLEALAGVQDDANPLVEILLNADRASVDKDLQVWRSLTGAAAAGIPVEQYLLEAMRRLLRSQTWTVNAPGARVWVLPEGVHIVWRLAAEEIIDLLAQDSIPGIPRDPDTLADILIERGVATARELNGVFYRYWIIVPDGMATGRNTTTRFYTLRLASAEWLFESGVPPPVSARVLDTEPDTAVVPTPLTAVAALETERETAADSPSTLTTTPATPLAIVTDFIRRLETALAQQQLPFPITEEDGRLHLPYREALDWYIAQPGARISRSALVGALMRAPTGAVEIRRGKHQTMTLVVQPRFRTG